MKNNFLKTVYFLAFFLLGMWTRGEARVMTLQECMDSALANNPSVAAATLSVEKARIMKGTAFNPPFTSVTLKQETTGGGGPENGVAFNQEFEFPSIYVARHHALDARVDLERSRLSLLSNQLKTDISKAYHTLIYYNEILNINTQLDTLYGTFCHIASVRLKEGEGGPLELLNAERVREKNLRERLMIESQYAVTNTELKRLIGVQTDITPSDTALTPLPYRASEFDFSKTPGGRTALDEISVAEREVRVAKNEFLPGIHVGATAQAFIKSFNPYHIDRQPFEKGNFMAFEVGISVPLFFGATSSRLKAAQMETTISRLNYEYADSEASTELKRLTTILSTLNDKLEYFRSTSLPRAKEIQRIAQVSYEYGDIDYIEYISNIETVFSVLREYADCIHEYNQTIIALESLKAE